ncbi:MAG: AMP-binding protein [Cyanobacteria bacterium P01_A01_bin.15]
MSFSNVNASQLSISLRSPHTIDQTSKKASPRKQFSPVQLPKDGCIHHLFERQVRQTPHAIAILTEHTQFTYQKLNRQANRLAYQLLDLGISPGQQIGICVEPSLDMVVGLLAVLKAGGAYVLIEPTHPIECIRFILQDTQVKILLSQTQFEQSLANCLPYENTTLICLDRDRWTNMQSCPNPTTTATPDRLMCVCYTAHSTNHLTTDRPKEAVRLSHSSLCDRLCHQQATFSLTAQDRILQNISFSFDPAVWQIFWPLLVGAKLVLPRPEDHQDAAYLSKLIASQDISVVALMPPLLRLLLKQPDLAQCSALNHIFCGSEVLPTELQQQLQQRFSEISIHLYNSNSSTKSAKVSIEAA